jgi:photosystem II stability/assembly factor-like uncharacterized protein
MKKLLLSIELVILISSIIFSQTEWEHLGLTSEEIFDIAIDGNGNIYAGVLLGTVYKSTDNGVTWELKNNGLPPAIGEDLEINNNQIYLATNVGLYKTTDGGDNWFRIAQSIPFTDFDIVTVIPNGYIFTSVFNMSTGGVFRSTNDGATWEPTSFTGFGAIDIGINSNGVMFFGNHTINWFGIFRSFDLGMTWEWLTPYIAASALEYLNDGSVLAGAENGPTNDAGIYKTTNNGNNWFNTNTFNDLFNEFSDFVLDTNDDIYVSVIGTQQGVYLSTDSGGSWSFKGLSNVYVNCLSIDSSGYLYAGTHLNGIFRTPGRTTPVELISFAAVVNEKNVILSWITETELNNRGFEVERATYNNLQTGNWEVITFVPGRGTTTERSTYNYTDKNLSSGSYDYRIKQIDYNGSYTYYDLQETVEISEPFSFALEQNYPNPFNPSTTISYSIPSVETRDRVSVQLKVYDVLGNEIATIVNEEKPAGTYEIEFNASYRRFFC